MPNFFSAFTSEVFRPIVTLLIPGAIGTSTWFIGLIWHFPVIRELVRNNPAETGLVLLLVMIFVGLVLEDVGARYETWLDGKADRRNGDHYKNWNKYLRTSFVAEPIGRRYVRTLVLRLKFELGVASSMVSAALGLLCLAHQGLNWQVVLVNEGICLMFAVWGLWESSKTHRVLADNRANLLEDIRVVR